MRDLVQEPVDIFQNASLCLPPTLGCNRSCRLQARRHPRQYILKWMTTNRLLIVSREFNDPLHRYPPPSAAVIRFDQQGQAHPAPTRWSWAGSRRANICSAEISLNTFKTAVQDFGTAQLQSSKHINPLLLDERSETRPVSSQLEQTSGCLMIDAKTTLRAISTSIE